MSFIMDSDKYAKRLGEVCQTYCADCLEETVWEAGKVSDWIKVFDIPLVPIKQQYFICCSQCGDDFSLTRKEFNVLSSTFVHSANSSNSTDQSLVFKYIRIKQLAARQNNSIDPLNSRQVRFESANSK